MMIIPNFQMKIKKRNYQLINKINSNFQNYNKLYYIIFIDFSDIANISKYSFV